MTNRSDPWPYLTHDLPGTGGIIRERREDFFVEEVPLYTPKGEGTHLYLHIEKEGMPTFEAVDKLARALGRKKQEFGYAGLKDSEAVTRQYLSIEHMPAAAVRGLSLDGIRILEAVYHRNKLKMGHLKGNRFRIRVRRTGPGASGQARAVLERLARRGVPNFFGPQRFGLFGNSHHLGLALLKRDYKAFTDILVGTERGDKVGTYGRVVECYRAGDYKGALTHLGRTYKYEGRALRILAQKPDRFEKAVAGLDKRMLRFYLSAFQSHFFNRYLAQRLERIDRLEKGEIAYIHGKGASFLVEDPEQEAKRLKAFEISPSGPMYGSQLLRAKGNPGRQEDLILKETGLKIEEMRGVFGIRFRGARRPLRVPLESWDVKEDGAGLVLSFFLPLGAYATVLLREVTKGDDLSI
jgi:tRNA pseudouridine13 synthase